MCGDQQSLLEVRRGLLAKPATISLKQQKHQPLALKMQGFFGCLYCTLFPKLSDMRTCHCTEEIGFGPSKVTGTGGEMVLFPLILLAPFQQKEGDTEDAEKGWRSVGFLAANCHIWGGLEHPQPETAAHGDPAPGQPQLRAPGGELRGGCTGPGRVNGWAGFTPVQEGVRGGAQQAEPRTPLSSRTPGRSAPLGLPGTPPFPSRFPPRNLPLLPARLRKV